MSQPEMPHPPGSPPWYTSTSQTRPDARLEPAATAAFVLSLCSFVIWVLPAVVAIAMAKGAKRNIKASAGLRKGSGLATAAQVISCLTIVATLLGLAAISLV